MAKLGDVFPESLRAKLADDRLIPGSVVKIHCDFTTPPKDKYLVIACVTPKLLVFVVNSEINEFIQNRPDLLKCQVSLNQADYEFLQHDSFADCSISVDAIDVTNLRDQLIQNLHDVYQGSLRPMDISHVQAATKFSRTITVQHKGMILTALDIVLSNGT